MLIQCDNEGGMCQQNLVLQLEAHNRSDLQVERFRYLNNLGKGQHITPIPFTNIIITIIITTIETIIISSDLRRPDSKSWHTHCFHETIRAQSEEIEEKIKKMKKNKLNLKPKLLSDIRIVWVSSIFWFRYS